MKKIILSACLLTAATTLLAGCSQGSNSQNSSTSESVSTSMYATDGLNEITTDKIKFYSSKDGSDWKDLSVQGFTAKQYLDVTKGNNISVIGGTISELIPGNVSFSDLDESLVESAFSTLGVEDVKSEKVQVGGKDAFKTTYGGKIGDRTLSGVQYIIDLKDDEGAAVTLTSFTDDEEIEKDFENIINTIEKV